MEAIARALADFPASTLWAYSLAAGLLVILIVALLLMAIIRAAKRIDHHAAKIWETGKNIAGNTAAIWMLEKTNSIAGQMLESARSIESRAKSIDDTISALANSLRSRS